MEIRPYSESMITLSIQIEPEERLNPPAVDRILEKKLFQNGKCADPVLCPELPKTRLPFCHGDLIVSQI
jgi:hypothetical protein